MIDCEKDCEWRDEWELLSEPQEPLRMCICSECLVNQLQKADAEIASLTAMAIKHMGELCPRHWGMEDYGVVDDCERSDECDQCRKDAVESKLTSEILLGDEP